MYSAVITEIMSMGKDTAAAMSIATVTEIMSAGMETAGGKAV